MYCPSLSISFCSCMCSAHTMLLAVPFIDTMDFVCCTWIKVNDSTATHTHARASMKSQIKKMYYYFCNWLFISANRSLCSSVSPCAILLVHVIHFALNPNDVQWKHTSTRDVLQPQEIYHSFETNTLFSGLCLCLFQTDCLPWWTRTNELECGCRLAIR